VICILPKYCSMNKVWIVELSLVINVVGVPKTNTNYFKVVLECDWAATAKLAPGSLGLQFYNKKCWKKYRSILAGSVQK
jgi:hypothetical protein